MFRLEALSATTRTNSTDFGAADGGRGDTWMMQLALLAVFGFAGRVDGSNKKVSAENSFANPLLGATSANLG